MERKPFPSETQERFIVRLPDGMRDRIAAEAKKRRRSMNAEFIARLSDSLSDEAEVRDTLLTQLFREQKQTIDELQEVVKALTVELHHLRKAKSK